VTLEAVIVVVGTIATVIAAAVLLAQLPAREPRPASRPAARGRSRPSQLLRIERIVERSRDNGLTAHTQLRPLLVDVAESRLARRGLGLADEEAWVLLGPEAWEMVRPGRPAPPDGRAPGVAPQELEAALDRLEAL
jgi:hypothetical protein